MTDNKISVPVLSLSPSGSGFDVCVDRHLSKGYAVNWTDPVGITRICFENGLSVTQKKIEALIELDKQLDEFFKVPFFVTMSCRNSEEFLKEVNRLQTERLDALEKIYVAFKEKCEEK